MTRETSKSSGLRFPVRVFSGIQPSGDIHIGNYLGAVKTWVALSKEHECLFCVVDDHAITVDYDPGRLPQRTFDAVLTTMACGLDPDQCVLFVQSHVPQHTELTWLFNTITPLGSLFRMTQFKDKARNAMARTLQSDKGKAFKSALLGLRNVAQEVCTRADALRADVDALADAHTWSPKAAAASREVVMRLNDELGSIMQQLQVGLGIAEASCGLFDYPVLQAADILLYKASLVPVGEDQEQHLELCREIATRFNKRFRPLFPKVRRVEGHAPKVVGLDGKAKMSKSLNNYIGVLDSPETIAQRLRPAFTDPARVRKGDPGHPDVCNIFSLHRLFSDAAVCDEVAAGCTGATLGCFACKEKLAAAMAAELAPIRDRADHLRRHPHIVRDALAAGADTARRIAEETMAEVKDAMGLGPAALPGRG